MSEVRSLLLTVAVAATTLPVGAVGQQPDGKFVSADWLASQLEAPDLVLVEVHLRQVPEELIPGSVLLPYGSIIQQADVPVELLPVEDLADVFGNLGIGTGTRVVLSGSPLAVGRAFMTLDYLGHGDRTWALDGGVPAWKATGRETTSEPATPRAATFVPDVQTDLIVSAEWVRDRLDDSDVSLLDARPVNEYTGELDQEGLRGGHIPGAYNLFFRDLYRGEDDPRLIDEEQIRARFAEMGAEPGGTVVNYCFIGMRASFTYLVSRHLGYDTRLYDRSWAEWGARDDLPLGAGEDRN